MKLTDIMKQAQNLQRDMAAAQQSIESLRVTGESGAGLVRVQASGDMVVQRIEIDQAVMTEAKDVLEDLLAAAVNDALRKAKTASQEKMGSFTSGLNLPDDFKLPF